jgi:hypothetical protein
MRTGSSECVPKLPAARVVVNAVMPMDSKSGMASRVGSPGAVMVSVVSLAGPPRA